MTKKKTTATKKPRKKARVDPITLIKACFPDIRRVTAIRGEVLYFITDDGRVISMSRGAPRILAPKSNSRSGHLNAHAGRRTGSVARLVLEAFGPGPRSRKYRAYHVNGDPRDNRIENLQWMTDSDWKRDVEHPDRQSRAAFLDPRTARVRIRSRFPDVGRLVAVEGQQTYFVDDCGRIYTVWGEKARRLTPRIRAPLTLRDPLGGSRQVSWGTIVAQAFLEPRPSTGHYLVHKDGDPLNYHPSNLAWEKRGAVPNPPRFTPEEIRAIRFLKDRGESSARIARAFDCNDASVDEIGWRKTYASVPDSSQDPLEALPAKLRARIVRETNIGASLDPAAYRRAKVDAIRAAFPDAGPLRPIAGETDYFTNDRGEIYSTRRRVRRLTPPKNDVHFYERRFGRSSTTSPSKG